MYGLTSSEANEGKSPQQPSSLRSSLELTVLWASRSNDLTEPRLNFSLAGTLRYMDTLPTLSISSYVELDLWIGWQYKNWEGAMVGQNLLDNQHPEFKPSFINTRVTEVERGVYAKVIVRF